VRARARARAGYLGSTRTKEAAACRVVLASFGGVGDGGGGVVLLDTRTEGPQSRKSASAVPPPGVDARILRRPRRSGKTKKGRWIRSRRK